MASSFICMILVTFVVLNTRTIAFELRTEQCLGAVQIGSRFYSRETLMRASEARILDAIYDEQDNLFFTKLRKWEWGYSYDIYMLKSGEKDARRIDGIDEGCGYSTSVDRNTGEVFFATANGLMKYYNNITHYLGIPYALYGQAVASVFIDKLGTKYLTEVQENGSELVYRLEGDRKFKIYTFPELWTFSVSKDNTIYYVQDGNLFILKPNESQGTRVASSTISKLAQITFDADGTLYIASDSLYYCSVGLDDLVSVEMNQPGNVTAIAFDKQENFALAVDFIFKFNRVYGCHSNKSLITDN